MISGGTTSRLAELRKYSVTNVFANQYFINGSINNDGVDLPNSNPSTEIVYYLGGIKYIDYFTGTNSGKTINFFTPQGITPVNFVFLPEYKNPNKEGIISNPKINDDVFIDRQEISAFDNNYRLEQIKSLNELLTYAGGIFFNVVSNT